MAFELDDLDPRQKKTQPKNLDAMNIDDLNELLDDALPEGDWDSVGGLLIALLPIPVTAFDLLPAYWIHARFLGFYTPVVCLRDEEGHIYAAVRALMART